MNEKLIPIKVKVGQKEDGGYDYPKFGDLISKSSKIGFTRGIKLDKTSGLAKNTPDSPIGTVWGLKFVSQAFYDEAVTAFSDKIVRLTPQEAEDFWNNKAQIEEDDNIVDTERLKGLDAQRNLIVAVKGDTTDVDVRIVNALDPNHKERGINKNKNRYFADVKFDVDIDII